MCNHFVTPPLPSKHICKQLSDKEEVLDFYFNYHRFTQTIFLGFVSMNQLILAQFLFTVIHCTIKLYLISKFRKRLQTTGRPINMLSRKFRISQT